MLSFLPSIQMMPPYLLHFKKIKMKHNINSLHLFLLLCSFSWFLGSGMGSMGHGQRPTHQPPLFMANKARPSRESGRDPQLGHTMVTFSGHFLTDSATKFVFNASKSVFNTLKLDFNASKLTF
jgi:hypothetical protein